MAYLDKNLVVLDSVASSSISFLQRFFYIFTTEILFDVTQNRGMKHIQVDILDSEAIDRHGEDAVLNYIYLTEKIGSDNYNPQDCYSRFKSILITHNDTEVNGISFSVTLFPSHLLLI